MPRNPSIYPSIPAPGMTLETIMPTVNAMRQTLTMLILNAQKPNPNFTPSSAAQIFVTRADLEAMGVNKAPGGAAGFSGLTGPPGPPGPAGPPGSSGGTPSTLPPNMDGTATVGASLAYAREDHIHPSDTTRAPLNSPAFTGSPTAPTVTPASNSSTKIATTAFVYGAVAAVSSGVVNVTAGAGLAGGGTGAVTLSVAPGGITTSMLDANLIIDGGTF